MARSRREQDLTTRYSSVVVADTTRLRVWGGEVVGYVWTGAAISPAGKIAGSIDRQGNGGEINSAIVVFDPEGAPVSAGYPYAAPKIIATEPLGSISEFGVTAETIVWRTPDGFRTAPFGEPNEP